jgi:glycerol-3-phosphate dehydrogenase (NAD(P)+)
VAAQQPSEMRSWVDYRGVSPRAGRVAVLNAGGWGTALAVLLARRGQPVALWCRRPELAARINAERQNPDYLPAVPIPARVAATADLEAAVAAAGVLVFAPISAALRDLARQAAPLVAPGALVVHGAKGLEAGSLLRGTQVIEQELGRRFRGKVAVLSGPTHAEEVGRGIPTAAVVACRDAARAAALQELFSTPAFRVYTNPDTVGVELCGAVKNVAGIAAGISDGLGYGDNAKAALTTRFIAELTRLVHAQGGRLATVSGLAGIGDILATTTSRHSRNRWCGEQLGRGRGLEEILGSTRMVVEGVPAARAALALAERSGVELPITRKVCSILFEGQPPLAALAELMTRQMTSEASV